VNPYVVIADATPTHYTAEGYTDDLFGSLKYSVRSTQIAPELNTGYDDCNPDTFTNSFYNQSQKQIIDETVPSWYIGVGFHLLLALAALFGAVAKLRTPARRLGKGSRIA